MDVTILAQSYPRGMVFTIAKNSEQTQPQLWLPITIVRPRRLWIVSFAKSAEACILGFSGQYSSTGIASSFPRLGF
jgi:hypothetical protein